MDFLTRIAERKISQAIEEGKLTFDQWKNRPLPEDNDPQIPDDLKMAYKILKNAGYLPPEIETKKEIQTLEEMISRTEDEHLRLKQMKKLNVLFMKIDASRGRPVNFASQDDYYCKVVERVTLNSRKNEK